MKDSDNNTVQAGDTVSFSYGIPPVYVKAEVIRRNGRLVALTPGHTPEQCSLETLNKCVGGFWKV